MKLFQKLGEAGPSLSLFLRQGSEALQLFLPLATPEGKAISHSFLYLNLGDKRIKSPFTAFVFWMRRCVLLTNNMRASWGVGSVLGAGVIAGSRTGIVAPLGPLR